MEPLPTFTKLPAAKQKKIVHVALQEFSTNGYQKTSINTIVKRLGIAKGSIFQYFCDKESLFQYVLNICLDEVKNYLRAVRDQTTHETLFVRIEKTLRAGAQFVRERPHLYQLYLQMLFESRLPLRKTILLTLRQYSHKYLRGLIDTAAARGELRPGLNSDAVAFFLDAVLDRFLQSQCVEHLDAGLGLFKADPQMTDDWIGQIVEIFRVGLAGSAGPSSQPSRDA